MGTRAVSVRLPPTRQTALRQFDIDLVQSLNMQFTDDQIRIGAIEETLGMTPRRSRAGFEVSPLTTKGDIWVFGTADDRLPVGLDAKVLQADSAAATGLSWSPVTGSGDVVRAHNSSLTGTTSGETVILSGSISATGFSFAGGSGSLFEYVEPGAAYDFFPVMEATGTTMRFTQTTSAYDSTTIFPMAISIGQSFAGSSTDPARARATTVVADIYNAIVYDAHSFRINNHGTGETGVLIGDNWAYSTGNIWGADVLNHAANGSAHTFGYVAKLDRTVAAVADDTDIGFWAYNVGITGLVGRGTAFRAEGWSTGLQITEWGTIDPSTYIFLRGRGVSDMNLMRIIRTGVGDMSLMTNSQGLRLKDGAALGSPTWTVDGNIISGIAGTVDGKFKANSVGGGSISMLPASTAAAVTLTLPAATDTLIGKATSDVLTNKQYDTAGSGNVLKVLGVDISTAWTTVSTSGATLAVTALVGTITSASATMRYKLVGKTVVFQMTVTVTTNGTGSDGVVISGLPFTTQSATGVGHGRCTTGTGATLSWQLLSTTSLVIVDYLNNYPAASGSVLQLDGVLEIA